MNKFIVSLILLLKPLSSQEISQGFILFTPFNTSDSTITTYLINQDLDELNTWVHDNHSIPASMPYLNKDSTIWYPSQVQIPTMESGGVGGKIELMIQRIVDAWMCFPGLILLLVLMSVFGIGILQIIIVLSLRWGFSGSRIIRGAVISLKENFYIKASVSVGCSTSRIILKHIIPNLMAPTIILFTTRVPDIIMTEAALSFLGFGIPPPDPTWGGMLSGSARQYMVRAPWMVIWPGLALAVVVYCINMFGDALRDILDPKLRGVAGKFDAS